MLDAIIDVLTNPTLWLVVLIWATPSTEVKRRYLDDTLGLKGFVGIRFEAYIHMSRFLFPS